MEISVSFTYVIPFDCMLSSTCVVFIYLDVSGCRVPHDKATTALILAYRHLPCTGSEAAHDLHVILPRGGEEGTLCATTRLCERISWSTVR